MYIDKETGDYPLSSADIIARHGHNTSFPLPFEAPDRHAFVTESALPEHDPRTHKATELPPEMIEGEYVQRWEIVSLSPLELEQLEQERLAAEQAAKDAARIVITKRQTLLALYLRKGIKTDQIDAVINAIPDEETRYMARVDWDGSVTIESDSTTVLMIAEALDIPEPELPDLFEFAQAL